jgi:hypothetical protein
MATLIISFIILASLTLWFVMGAEGLWYLKAIVIALALYFSGCMFYSIDSLKGHPSNSQLPVKFEIHYGVVKQPNRVTEFPGSILMWVTELKPYETLFGKVWIDLANTCRDPRVYALPYSRSDHKQMQGVLKKLKEGKRVIGENKGQGGIGAGKGKGEAGEGRRGTGKPGSARGEPGSGRGEAGRQGNARSGGWSFSLDSGAFFHELPPPVMPHKVGGGQ